MKPVGARHEADRAVSAELAERGQRAFAAGPERELARDGLELELRIARVDFYDGEDVPFRPLLIALVEL